MNLSNDIIAFLFANGKMNLPGLGTLLLQRTSAKRNIAKNKIIAPGYDLEFFDNQFDEKSLDEFIKFIASKHNLDYRKAENKIKKYSLELLNNIANFGSATIDNLGTFSRKKDILNFELSPVLSQLIKDSYPDYPLVFIKRDKTITTPVSSRKQEYRRQNKTDNNWIFPLFMLTLASIIFVCLMYCFFNLIPDNTQKKPVIADNAPAIEKQKANDQDTAENIIFEEERDTTSGTNQAETPTQTSGTAPTDNSKEQHQTPSNTSETEKITLDELLDMAPEMRKKYEKTCIIITGSFVRKSNARRMIKRLTADGFTPYSEKYGRFHRTGVLFDCDEKPLKQFLYELRKTIDKESWVLKWK